MMEQTTGTDEMMQTEPVHVDDALLRELNAVPIFETLTTADLQCLGEMEMVRLPQGQLLAKQGETLNAFWVVLEGTLELFERQGEGRETKIFEASRGFTFGELSLLGNIPNSSNLRSTTGMRLLRFSDAAFWRLMTVCPKIRQGILQNMAHRLQKVQSRMVQQEKMASLGTMAAGLMHELNNPGSAAKRAASQLRENLRRIHELTAKFTKINLNDEQKSCLWELQEQALSEREPVRMNTLEQSDAEEAMAEWMEKAQVKNAWKLAPTLVSMGIEASELECARHEFPGDSFTDALSWLEAMASSVQLVSTIEESLGRVSDLVRSVKAYAYEGKGQRQTLDVNESIHATLVMLGHKLREKQVVLEKDLESNLPVMESTCTGLNQIWTNLLDNAIDAVKQNGHIRLRTWKEMRGDTGAASLCVLIADDGSGIPPEIQAHVFDPFYTTKDVGVGTGLGLGIVHRIVDQFGGTIHFSSTPGDTEFVVRLPVGRK